ncbi:uncharacterized protein M421DRAFT_308351 [Didymella exigua CBS 183.55]|uniref:Uncharacterized protein n=1 Tax=Didymella exigua CBS 183.55 TaxID=1150837 RepID=A0A6A5R883_9PLEO|nr:uncharacterized protein M421DRAFT_328730 [Didymella exigua CBS 183.55]XP_033443972.1 uncharacterized protein M421DRAFT_308351 [Didymella exigua CBS 183.55]KAF1923184.1 hypothetical protein M421DRAFT_328730 [Didymella exigua CBS 183.55]KAF1923719.1 hypothetical protein M421DRAFT_308351 [Didymella exigua CBS 183.55]
MLYCSGIIAQLICRPSHGTICNRVQVHDSAWPATETIALIQGAERIKDKYWEKEDNRCTKATECLCCNCRPKKMKCCGASRSDRPRSSPLLTTLG